MSSSPTKPAFISRWTSLGCRAIRRLRPLPPYCPELNPVERFGGLLKAALANRLSPSLRRLENHLVAAARPWSTPAAVAGLIHGWLAAQVNSGAPA